MSFIWTAPCSYCEIFLLSLGEGFKTMGERADSYAAPTPDGCFVVEADCDFLCARLQSNRIELKL